MIGALRGIFAKRTSLWSISAALPAMALLLGTNGPLRDNSYLWHRVIGVVQTDAGAVATSDPFSFTSAGVPWRTQSWLADLLYAQLHFWFGLSAGRMIVVVAGSLIFATLVVIARESLQADLRYPVWLALSIVVLIAFMNPRPVIFSFVMMALTVLVERRRSLLWAFPLVIWLWASIHGSFFLGWIVLGIGYVARPERRIIFASVVGALAANLTAHGWAIWSVLLAFGGTSEALDLIQEWQTPDFATLPFISYVLLLAVVVMGYKRGLVTGRMMLGVLAWSVFAATANRSVPLAWVALTPAVTAGLAGISPRITEHRAPLPLIVVIAVVMVATPLALGSRSNQLDAERFPTEAITHLTADRVFHDEATGSAIIHFQWPARQVYVDDRAELYGEHYVNFVEANNGLPGWRDEFERFEIEEALVSNKKAIAEILRAEGWTEVFTDEWFSVLRAP